MSRQAHLPPRCPFQKKSLACPVQEPFSPPAHQYNSLPPQHQKSISQSSILEEQPAWLDELLNDSGSNSSGIMHRRSASDSLTLLDGLVSLEGFDKFDETESSASCESDSSSKTNCIYGPNSPRGKTNITFAENAIVSALSEYVSPISLQYLDRCISVSGAAQSESVGNASGAADDVSAEAKPMKWILQKCCIFGVFDMGAATFLESPCNIADKKDCPNVQLSRTVKTNSSQWNEMLKSFASMPLSVLSAVTDIIYATNQVPSPIENWPVIRFSPKLPIFLITTTSKDRVNNANFWGMPGIGICEKQQLSKFMTNRIPTNWHPGQRSRVRKLQYIAELERTVSTYEAIESDLTAKVASLLQRRVTLSMENRELKQQMLRLQQEKVIVDAQYRSLRKELERLKCLAHSRNGKLSTNFRRSSAAEMSGSDAAWQMLDFGKLDLN